MRVWLKLGLMLLIPGLLGDGMPNAAAQVTQTVDDQRTVSLPGNTRPEATLENDRGRVADGLALDHMQLLLKRPAKTEAALVSFIDGLYDKKSSNFHRWLTAKEFGKKFGPPEADIGAVTAWLTRHGFAVNGIPANRMMIDFSGTAKQVREAFRTEIHSLKAGGARHIANMSDPHIPEALLGIVTGIVSLHDFRPHTFFKKKPDFTFIDNGYIYEAVAPADLAAIYNFNPLFNAGLSGQGQTIVVIEDTDLYSTDDWNTFRSVFGLSSYSAGSLSQVQPGGSSFCSDPGIVPNNEVEAELDAEWAGAAAPSATIEVAACQDTTTTFGGLIALQNLINDPSPPTIISMSYGECEAENGAAANAAYYATYQQAVALGISVFVSAGDEGAASCDADLSTATHGVAVSGFASTPYNVAVGGTDFGDTYARTNGAYWTLGNTSVFETARSYINEIPWNDSCGSELVATILGYKTTYGQQGLCNSAVGREYFRTTVSGSGGPSGCATGVPSIGGVVSGTCAGYGKPSWQSLIGNPADGVRDIPDVSLFAANGLWGHYYVICDSDTADGGAACTGTPNNWSGAGGTSFASPILAGIQALVNQQTGASQGNPNPVYYALAAAEYGADGSSSCNSSNGNTVGSSCIFYDVTQGDMDVNCMGAQDCYEPKKHKRQRRPAYSGVLSTNSGSYALAYRTGTGWDFATGIGSVNAANLVNNW